MFRKHRKYYICDTYKKIDNLTWRYILITNIWPKRVKETFFTLKELGFNEDEFILYEYQSNDIKRIKINDFIEVGRLRKYNYKYYILCPITENGMAIIGCPDKFITCSKKLILNVNSTKDSLIVSVDNIEGAIVKLLIYSKKKPASIQVENDIINIWNYEESLHMITLNLKFKVSGKKNILIQN